MDNIWNKESYALIKKTMRMKKNKNCYVSATYLLANQNELKLR